MDKFKVTLAHPVHGTVETEVEVDRHQSGTGADEYHSLYPTIARAAQRNAASRYVDYESFGSDSAYADRLDVVQTEFKIEDMELVGDGPLIRYQIYGIYPGDGGTWGDWVYARTDDEAEFQAKWQMALNDGGHDGDDSRPTNDHERFSDCMDEQQIKDCWPAPVTKDEALAAIRECVTFAEAYSKKMDDPNGDGTGNGARPPTGDDYNALYAAIMAMTAKVGAAL